VHRDGRVGGRMPGVSLVGWLGTCGGVLRDGALVMVRDGARRRVMARGGARRRVMVRDGA
jgi:hypothetical protein